MSMWSLQPRHGGGFLVVHESGNALNHDFTSFDGARLVRDGLNAPAAARRVPNGPLRRLADRDALPPLRPIPGR
jgi:hypothetical protein